MSKVVSIIVASYNHEKYVEDCLESIKKQTYKDIELIITDDCSGDKTYSIIQEWCIKNRNRFVNCVYTKHEVNQGVSKTYNDMILASQGEYIKCFASDDMMYPNAIETMVKAIEENEADMVYTNVVDVDEYAHYPISCDYKRKHYNKIPPNGKNLIDKLYVLNEICAPSVLLKRNTFEKYGLFDENMLYEDWEYWLRVTSRGGMIAYDNNVTIAYRRLKSSASMFIESDKERFENIYRNNKMMLERYAPLTKSGMDGFMNYALVQAIKIRNDRLVNEISKENFARKIMTNMRLVLFRLLVRKRC